MSINLARTEYRLSRYSIFSERLPSGKRVLLHGITGAMDIVDESVLMGLQSYGRFRGAAGVEVAIEPHHHKGDSAPLSPEEVEVLVDRGHLTTRSDDAEITLAAEVAGTLHAQAATRPSFLILPTLDCNYRCTYCFERAVQKHLKSTKCGANADIVATHAAGNVVMTSTHVEAIYKAIPTLQERHGDPRDSVQIVLYGGEPLDARNADVVRDIVKRGTARGHTFAAVTNGHDLHEFLDLFGPHAIQQVQVSLDGPKNIHDRRRIHLGRESSFDRVIQNVAALEALGQTLIQIRVHIDPGNIEAFEELLADFGGRSWLDHPNILIYANTVYDTGTSTVGGRLDLDEIDSRLSGLVRPFGNVLLNAPSINLRAKMLPALMQGLQIPIQGNYCAANTGQYLFCPDGHLYSCWESVGKADSRIGRYTDDAGQPDLQLTERATEEWFSRHVGEIDACRVCPMALCCGGGCAQFAKYRTGEQRSPYCDSFEAVFRKALVNMTEVYLQRLAEHEAGIQPAGLVRANYG